MGDTSLGSFAGFASKLQEGLRASGPWPEGMPGLALRGPASALVATQQLSSAQLSALLATASRVRELAATSQGRARLGGVLADKRVMHWFGQPSTRTAQSFLAAAELLGARGQLVTDLSVSSLVKGESVADSVRVIAELFDALVIRHASPLFTLEAIWGLAKGRRPIPVISAGMGALHHVTQSLLDLLTLSDAWQDQGGLAGKRVVVVGDVARNRAARSLAYGLALSGAGAIEWVTPPKFAPDPELEAFLRAHGLQTARHASLEACVQALGPKIDAIYMTRLQQEWDQTDGKSAPPTQELGTDPAFVLDPKLGSALSERCWILHPLPRVNELPDAWDEDPRLLIWHQVKSGVYARAAVLATLMGQAQALG